MNALIGLGYLNGVASYFSPKLFPCLLGYRNLSLATIFESTERVLSIIAKAQPCAKYNRSGLRKELLSAYDRVSGSQKRRCTFSFVVRTLFKRSHLLRRCLISIDYLRRSLDVQVEIVIASDVDSTTADRNIAELRNLFPVFIFTFADGNKESGVSRARNLKAGIKQSGGNRVFIIDDDDYYLPMAAALLAKTTDPEFSDLLLLDAQIVNEKWTQTERQFQREVLSYGQLYSASSWRTTLTGSNSLPLCSIVYPGDFLRRAIEEYEFSYDLSEDFIFHLVVFSHPFRPSIRVTEGVSVHQSHRGDADNVSTAADRTNWCLDTGNGIFDLLFKQRRQFDTLAETVCRSQHDKSFSASRLAAAQRQLNALVGALSVIAAEGPTNGERVDAVGGKRKSSFSRVRHHISGKKNGLASNCKDL